MEQKFLQNDQFFAHALARSYIACTENEWWDGSALPFHTPPPKKKYLDPPKKEYE